MHTSVCNMWWSRAILKYVNVSNQIIILSSILSGRLFLSILLSLWRIKSLSNLQRLDEISWNETEDHILCKKFSFCAFLRWQINIKFLLKGKS